MKLKKGQLVATGIPQLMGWERDGLECTYNPPGYNVHDFFDSSGRYLGKDQDGYEPVFHSLTDDEIKEYMDQDNA